MKQSIKVLEALKTGPVSIENARKMGINSMSSNVGKLRKQGYKIVCKNFVYTLITGKPDSETSTRKARLSTALDVVLESSGIGFVEIREALGIAQDSKERFRLISDLEVLVSTNKIRIVRDGGRNVYYPPYNCTVLDALYAPKPRVKVKQTRHIKEVAWKVQTHRATPSIQSPFASVYFGM